MFLSSIKVCRYFSFFVLGFFVAIKCSATFDSTVLSDCQKRFIEQHIPSKDIIKRLDTCFSGLDEELQRVLSGESPKSSRADLIALFNNAGFEVIVLVAEGVSLKNNHHEIQHAVLRHVSTPEYFLKVAFDKKIKRAALSRIVIADFINMLIDNSNFNMKVFKKIEKKLYHRPSRPEALVDIN